LRIVDLLTLGTTLACNGGDAPCTAAPCGGDTDTGTVDTSEPEIPGNYTGEMSLAITLIHSSGEVTASCNPDVMTLVTETLDIDGGFYNCMLNFTDVGAFEASGYINGSIEATALQAGGQLQFRAAEQSIGNWEWTGALSDRVLTGSATGTSSVDLGDVTIDFTYSVDFSAAQ
jgi:hypothetical protein